MPVSGVIIQLRTDRFSACQLLLLVDVKIRFAKLAIHLITDVL
jgi:hypothetical protein